MNINIFSEVNDEAIFYNKLPYKLEIISRYFQIRKTNATMKKSLIYQQLSQEVIQIWDSIPTHSKPGVVYKISKLFEKYGKDVKNYKSQLNEDDKKLLLETLTKEYKTVFNFCYFFLFFQKKNLETTIATKNK